MKLISADNETGKVVVEITLSDSTESCHECSMFSHHDAECLMTGSRYDINRQDIMKDCPLYDYMTRGD